MMRIFRISSTLCAILLITCSTALARPVPPLEGLEALRKVLAGITDFSADMTQEKKLSVMKRTLKMSGTVRFRKPDQFYMALNPPHATRMVLNDAVIEQANDRQEGHTRVVLPPEQGLKQWFSKLSVPVTSLPADFDISADLTNSLYTLKIAPRGTGQIREVGISFLADGTIKRMVIVERNGDKATMTFKNPRRNSGLTDRDFQLTP